MVAMISLLTTLLDVGAYLQSQWSRLNLRYYWTLTYEILSYLPLLIMTISTYIHQDLHSLLTPRALWMSCFSLRSIILELHEFHWGSACLSPLASLLEGLFVLLGTGCFCWIIWSVSDKIGTVLYLLFGPASIEELEKGGINRLVTQFILLIGLLQVLILFALFMVFSYRQIAKLVMAFGESIIRRRRAERLLSRERADHEIRDV